MRIRKQTAEFIKTELCIELTLQMTFSVLILAFLNSETRVEQGLEAIFEVSKVEIFGLSIPSKVIIVLNIAWGFISCWKSFLRGMATTKDHFPGPSEYLLGLHVALSVTIRCTNTIMFFAPTLGLLDLLRHFQGEIIPFEAAFGTERDELVYLPGKPLKWTWNDISRFDYSFVERNETNENNETYPIYNPEPPTLELYTFFSLEHCLNGFWILLFVQACLHILIKRFSNPMAFKRQSIIRMIALGIENCQIPGPMEDWDDYHGPINQYAKAQKKVEVEMGLAIVLNWIFSIIMTIPMWILCKSTST